MFYYEVVHLNKDDKLYGNSIESKMVLETQTCYPCKRETADIITWED